METVMLGDSLSTTVHHGLEGRASSRSSAVLAGWMLAEAPAAFSRVDAIRCSESTDVTSMSSPSSVVGLTKAAADMVMQSPPAACSNVFYISPVSVLSGKSSFFWLLRMVEISYRSSFLRRLGLSNQIWTAKWGNVPATATWMGTCLQHVSFRAIFLVLIWAQKLLHFFELLEVHQWNWMYFQEFDYLVILENRSWGSIIYTVPFAHAIKQ